MRQRVGVWAICLAAISTINAVEVDRRLVDAAKRGDMATVRTLLKQHVDVNVAQGDGATALHWVAHWGDLETASLLIRAGANVNAANDYGVTPLALACTNGDAALVEALLKAGANANARAASGETVLMRCARTGNTVAVKALLARDADVQAKDDKQGQTALMWAASQNHVDVVRALVERGANVQARTGAPSLTKASGSPVLADASDPPLAKPHGEGFTPVLFAAREGARAALEVLLANGGNVNDTAADGSSVLHVALANGHWDLAPWLLDRGADPNADGPGYTPLHWAVGSWGYGFLTDLHKYEWAGARGPGKLEMVKTLLDHGANPNARMKKGGLRTGTTGDGGALRLPGASAFVVAGLSSNAAVMRALLAAGADPGLTTDDGTTALMTAAGFGKGPRSVNETPYSDALETTKVVVETGLDVNATNQAGETALHGTAYFGADNIAQFLADHGAQVNARNQLGLTPMTVAQGFGGSGGVMSNPHVVEVLRKMGGVGDVDMAPAAIAEVRTPCPQPALVFNLQNPGYGRAWASTSPATQFINGTCADLKIGTRIRVKGIREVEKNWDGSVLASEITIVK
jgi:ankyrin repeat protein